MLKRATKRQGSAGGEESGPSPVPLRFRDDPLVWAGWLYVHDGLTQSDIASVMGVSRATVNSYLAEARARGIVRVNIDPSRLRDTEAAQALKQRFGLADCVVIPSDDGSRPLVDRLGAAGGSVLRNLLRAGDTLGRRLEPDRHGGGRPCRRRSAFPTCRWSRRRAAPAPASNSRPSIARRAWRPRSGPAASPSTAPALVSSRAMRDLLVAEPVVRERFDLIRRADKLIFGICNMRPDSLVFTSGLVDRERRQGLSRAAGDGRRGRALHGPGRCADPRSRSTSA